MTTKANITSTGTNPILTNKQDGVLGEEDWKPTGKEALEAGLIQWVTPP